MIRKIAKLLGLSILAVVVFFFLLVILISIFKPDNPEHDDRITSIENDIHELRQLWATHLAEHHPPEKPEQKVEILAVDSSKESQPETKGETAKSQNRAQTIQEATPEKESQEQQTKLITWDRTPAEQGIRVGDWITVQGYSVLMLGAYYEEGSWIEHNGKKYGGRLKYTNEPVSRIYLDSQAKSLHGGLSRYALTDKIAFVLGGVPAARKNPVARLYNELITVEVDLGRSDLRHIELKGRVYGISDMGRKFPDGTRRTLKMIHLESKTGELKLLTSLSVVDEAKRAHGKLLTRMRMRMR